MYCDVVFMFVMLLVLVLVTSTWYTTTHWLSRAQVRLTDDSVSDVAGIKLLGAFGGPEVIIIKMNTVTIVGGTQSS